MLPPTHPRGRGEKGRTEGTEKQQHGDSCAGRGGGTEAASETEELTSGPQSSEKTDGGGLAQAETKHPLPSRPPTQGQGDR